MSGTPHSLNKSVKKETLKNRKQYPWPFHVNIDPQHLDQKSDLNQILRIKSSNHCFLIHVWPLRRKCSLRFAIFTRIAMCVPCISHANRCPIRSHGSIVTQAFFTCYMFVTLLINVWIIKTHFCWSPLPLPVGLQVLILQTLDKTMIYRRTNSLSGNQFVIRP